MEDDPMAGLSASEMLWAMLEWGEIGVSPMKVSVGESASAYRLENYVRFFFSTGYLLLQRIGVPHHQRAVGEIFGQVDNTYPWSIQDPSSRRTQSFPMTFVCWRRAS
jgi:hypothetical protein